ncbi:MAG: hypothetical protein GXO47_12215 [Chlorobi bacterium]|nr:hypothetical protein [Chlorobiota bacterium]
MNSDNRNVKARELLISLLKSGKTVDVPAVSGLSMFPVLLPDDTIRVIPAMPSDLKRGMIIVYEKEHKIISHRFIRLRNGKVICKGDSLLSYDYPVHSKNLLGIVTKRFRKNRTQDLTTPFHKFTGFILSYITPLSGYIFHYMSFMWNRLKTQY